MTKKCSTPCFKNRIKSLLLERENQHGICPLGALLTDKVSENNGIFKVQYKGLRLAQRMQMPSAACMQKNYVPTCIAARKCKTIKAMASPTVAAPKREKDPKKRVVITGMGLVSVFGSNIDTFYNKLLEGESGISLIDRFDASSFPVRFAVLVVRYAISLQKVTLMARMIGALMIA